MKVQLMAGGLLAAGAVALLAAPAAQAGEFPPGLDSVRVPGTAQATPGQHFYFFGTCQTSTSDKVGPLTSPALASVETGALPGLKTENFSLPDLGWVRMVKTSIKPGTYPISFTCNGKKVSGKIVVATKTATKVPVKPVPVPAANAVQPQVAIKPKGAPQTGDGSYTEPSSDAGVFALTGGVAVLAGGAGIFAVRRRKVRGD